MTSVVNALTALFPCWMIQSIYGYPGWQVHRKIGVNIRPHRPTCQDAGHILNGIKGLTILVFGVDWRSWMVPVPVL